MKPTIFGISPSEVSVVGNGNFSIKGKPGLYVADLVYSAGLRFAPLVADFTHIDGVKQRPEIYRVFITDNEELEVVAEWRKNAPKSFPTLSVVSGTGESDDIGERFLVLMARMDLINRVYSFEQLLTTYVFGLSPEDLFERIYDQKSALLHRSQMRQLANNTQWMIRSLQRDLSADTDKLPSVSESEIGLAFSSYRQLIEDDPDFKAVQKVELLYARRVGDSFFAVYMTTVDGENVIVLCETEEENDRLYEVQCMLAGQTLHSPPWQTGVAGLTYSVSLLARIAKTVSEANQALLVRYREWLKEIMKAYVSRMTAQVNSQRLSS